MEYYKVWIWLQCNNSPVMMKIMGFYWPKQIVIQLMIISQHSNSFFHFHTVPPKIYRVFLSHCPCNVPPFIWCPWWKLCRFPVLRSTTWRQNLSLITEYCRANRLNYRDTTEEMSDSVVTEITKILLKASITEVSKYRIPNCSYWHTWREHLVWSVLWIPFNLPLLPLHYIDIDERLYFVVIQNLIFERMNIHFTTYWHPVSRRLRVWLR